MRGQVRVLEARRALIFAEQLIDNKYLTNLPIKDQERYQILLPKKACYLDGNIEVIRDAVEKYFLIRHFKAGVDENLFQVSFSPKQSGIQTGFTCDISDGNQTTRYFVKTHQHGPNEDTPKSLHPPDIKELFIYQLLYNLGIGPEVHFIVPFRRSKTTIYIATKDCHLALLSELKKETANMKTMIQIDLICRILCLRDCSTNSHNYGQVNGEPMIVDFRIENHSDGYFKSDLFDKFYEEDGDLYI